MKYKKILVKFSGEAFGPKHEPVDMDCVAKIVDEIKQLKKLGAQVAVVTGGGNVARGREAKLGSRLKAHLKGMRGTFQNVIPLEHMLKKAGIPVHVYSSFSINSKYPVFNQEKVLDDLRENKVLIFAGGTGHPFFTTDSASVLRALQIKAELFIKATKVDGVYSCDPMEKKNCRHYNKISYKKIIASELKVVDKMCVALAWENQLPIRVVKWEPGAIVKIVQGRNLGTIIE